MRPIRNSAKAVIVHNGRILVIEKKDSLGSWFLLPGGGQEPGETLLDALKRECFEELGVEVEVGNLLFVREYIGKNHEFASTDGSVHQIEFMFDCKILNQERLGTGTAPDSGQLGFRWLEMAHINSERLYPKILTSLLSLQSPGPVYLGDVN